MGTSALLPPDRLVVPGWCAWWVCPAGIRVHCWWWVGLVVVRQPQLAARSSSRNGPVDPCPNWLDTYHSTAFKIKYGLQTLLLEEKNPFCDTCPLLFWVTSTFK